MVKQDKSLVQLDNEAKGKLNEIKAYLLRKRESEKNLSQRISYRNLIGLAVKDYYEKNYEKLISPEKKLPEQIPAEQEQGLPEDDDVLDEEE